MSDILSRLKALGVTKGMPTQQQPPVKKASEQMDALLKAFPCGLVAENDCGYCFINRLVQPLTQTHGLVDMNAKLTPSPLFDSVMEAHISRKEDTLAFDTETSGLSNGSGSFIFMLGLGYFEGDQYIVDQLILPDLSSEPAFLRQTELIFCKFPVLLSYNGKSFDIPMLQSRIHFHMMPDFTRQMTHIDLLLQARRYWKPKLGSVRLANIERYVLKLQRGEEEVPGAMAPGLYRNYLADGDASHVAEVAYHNRIDVVSLSAFMLYLNDLSIRGSDDPSKWAAEGASETALIRHNLNHFSGEAVSRVETFTNKEKKALAKSLLKLGSSEQALHILEELAAGNDLESARNLMKYYQKQRDPENFIRCRDQCIRLISEDETLGKWSRQDKIAKLQKLSVKKGSITQ